MKPSFFGKVFRWQHWGRRRVGLFIVAMVTALWSANTNMNQFDMHEPLDIIPELHEPTLHELHTGLVGDVRRCASVYVRGVNRSMSVQEAGQYFETHKKDQSLKIGLGFIENMQDFTSLNVNYLRGLNGFFHFFHYLEFLVIAYEELLSLAGARVKMTQNFSIAMSHIKVPWIEVPHMDRIETCGSNHGINCFVTDLILQQSSKFAKHPNDWITKVYPTTTAYQVGLVRKMKHWKTGLTYNHEVENPREHADAALFLHRSYCDHGAIHKMWAAYVESFPAWQWHNDLMTALGAEPKRPKEKKKITVGYVDRQRSSRHLPNMYHQWLVSYMGNHIQVEFLHLKMEDYPPLEQVNYASRVDFLIGCHGNGLSHALWMPPERYVMEIFWNFQVQFDYATVAQLMKHKYKSIQTLNGTLMEIAPKNYSSVKPWNWKSEYEIPDLNEEAIQYTKDFLEQALGELLGDTAVYSKQTKSS